LLQHTQAENVRFRLKWGCREFMRPSVSSGLAESQFGPVLRVIFPGDSFGELALLQPHNLRTATVVAGLPPPQRQVKTQGIPKSSAAPSLGAELIQVSRALFDAVVTGLQAAQLESRLKLLSTIPVRIPLFCSLEVRLQACFRSSHALTGSKGIMQTCRPLLSCLVTG
jgi:hypothetical protein